MILIAVVDDDYGMMFNRRWQSKDGALRERILSLAEGGTLWVSPYTYRQFSDCGAGNIRTDEEFLRKAGPGEYCFAEEALAAPFADKIEKIILFRWNRKYPADVWFDLDLKADGWKLSETKEFPGSSHEKITEEVYVRG